jgi:hypothetical protein
MINPFLFYGHLLEEQSPSEIHALLKHNALRRILFVFYFSAFLQKSIFDTI